MPEEKRRDASSTRTSLFPIFAIVWASATLIHQVAASFWMAGWAGWLLIVAAFGVIFEPRCLFRFTVLILASLLNLYQKLPFCPNHILLEGMLHVTMLLGLLQLTLSGKFGGRSEILDRIRVRSSLLGGAAALKALYLFAPFVPKHPAIGVVTTFLLVFALCRYIFVDRPINGHGDLLVESFSSVFRLALVALYLLAALQKLNWDFFDPAVSCAVVINEKIAALCPFPLFPTSFLHASIWGTFFFYFAISLFLYIPKTRFFGFVLAIGFHLWLSVYPAFGVYSFSALVLAILVLFLPDASQPVLADFWRKILLRIGSGKVERGRSAVRWGIVIVTLGVLISQASCFLIIERSYAVFEIANLFGLAFFLAWGIWLSASFLVALWRSRRESPRMSHHPQPSLAWIGLAIVIFNGICPWIGLKTETTYSMYSNLRTEGESRGNHFFLKRIDLFSYQTDMVELVSSEPDLLAIGPRPRTIQQFANPGTIFPWFELRRLVSEHEGDVSLVYTRSDKRFKAARTGGEISGDPELFKRHPWFARKFLWFRRHLSLEGPMHCTH